MQRLLYVDNVAVVLILSDKGVRVFRCRSYTGSVRVGNHDCDVQHARTSDGTTQSVARSRVTVHVPFRCDLQTFPFRRCGWFSVTELNGLVTLSFDLLTLELTRNVTRGTDNLPANFAISATSLTVHTCPFNASMLRPASQAGPVHESSRVGKLVNAALLSLINEACVNVCCTTLLSS